MANAFVSAFSVKRRLSPQLTHCCGQNPFCNKAPHTVFQLFARLRSSEADSQVWHAFVPGVGTWVKHIARILRWKSMAMVKILDYCYE